MILQAVAEILILVNRDNKRGFGRVGAWFIICFVDNQVCVTSVDVVNFSQLDLHLVQEKCEPMELAQFEHGNCICRHD